MVTEMARRHENPSDWQDKPAAKAFSVEMERRGAPSITKALNIGNCAIALFRKRPEMDYLAILDEETDQWTFIFDRQPMVYWMGAVCLNKEAERMLHLVERSAGEFYDNYGWNVDAAVADFPSADEVDVYIQHLSSGDLHQDLQQQLKEDFENES